MQHKLVSLSALGISLIAVTGCSAGSGTARLVPGVPFSTTQTPARGLPSVAATAGRTTTTASDGLHPLPLAAAHTPFVDGLHPLPLAAAVQ